MTAVQEDGVDWFAIVPVRWICALDIMQQDCACDLFLLSLCAPLLSASVSSGVYFCWVECMSLFPPLSFVFSSMFSFPIRYLVFSTSVVRYLYIISCHDSDLFLRRPFVIA